MLLFCENEEWTEAQMGNKKNQESLPHKKKAQMLEDNAVAHQKYWESLPLEKKAKILEDKVKVQKKYQKSLPPKKKAKNFGR